MSALLLPRGFLLFLAILLIIGAVGYGLFEARRILAGPIITINEPRDGSAIPAKGAVAIAGVASNISFLTINDKPVLTDESGHFAETLTPAAGYAIFTVAATDRFGRRVSRSVRFTVLNYCPITTTA